MDFLDKSVLSSILFYHRQREKLTNTYRGRYLLLQEEEIIGNYGSWREACLQGYERLPHGSFFIKYCS